jgi:hypothetical protein
VSGYYGAVRPYVSRLEAAGVTWWQLFVIVAID